MIDSDYKNKLKNRYFGLLCEREKDRAWQKYLDAIILELEGFTKEEKEASVFLHLFHNTAVLRYLSYEYFRSVIFDCMNLVDRL